MTQIKLDNNGMLELSNNHQLQLIEGEEELMQALACRLRVFKGEWFLDTDLGLPYFQVFFGKKATSTMIYNAIRKEALKVPGIHDLVNTSIALNNNRTLDIKFDVVNKFGTSTYEGVI